MLRLSKSDRARGSIKERAEDFVVQEITPNGTVLSLDRQFTSTELGMQESDSGKFAVFVLQKRDWNTAQALRSIARRFRRGIRSTGFAGTKDRTSVSAQLCSVYGARASDLAALSLKDIKINGAWQSESGVKLGDLLGNSFAVRIGSEISSEFDKISVELGGIFPNYFGSQRFGYRDNNFEIGVHMLRGDFEAAVMEYLTNTNNERGEEAVEARKRLASERDFKAALGYFPMYLKYERSVIEYLHRFPENYANALRRLPRSLNLMFIHSVEAYIFNRELEERLRNGESKTMAGDLLCKRNAYGFPDISTVNKSDGEFVVGNILGYDTKEVNQVERDLMDEFGLDLEIFKVRQMNELNSRGSFRVLFAPYKDLACEHIEDGSMVRFGLPAGSYATVLLDEFIDVDGKEKQL